MGNPRVEYLEWKLRRSDVGCFFARHIAFRPAEMGQVIEVVGANSSAAVIAGSVAKRIERLVANPDVAAATLLFPEIGALERLAASMVALGSKPSWSVTSNGIEHPTLGSLTAVSVARQIPFGDSGSLPSEVLVLGPFEEFPKTRQAPVAAMEIFVGVPRPADPKTLQPTRKANLAHMDVHLPTDDAFQTMWNRSIQGRLKSLGGVDDLRAKAKVSFVVPPALAKALGLSP